jgi:hypothetical protein
MRTLVGATVVCWAVLTAGLSSQAPGEGSLDFDYFKNRIQPIFLKKRPGHARCIACHGQGTPLRLQPPGADGTSWSDEDSRKNFEAVRRVAQPGNPKSRLLVHALDEKAGGDFYHNGGKHWSSQDDPEWQVLRAWVMGSR